MEAGRDNGFTVPSFLPFFTVFAFAMILVSPFYLRSVAALRTSGVQSKSQKLCNRIGGLSFRP
jgi:hypothetical protein